MFIPTRLAFYSSMDYGYLSHGVFHPDELEELATNLGEALTFFDYYEVLSHAPCSHKDDGKSGFQTCNERPI